MLKRGLMIILGCFAKTSLFAATISVFVSFSMPAQLLEETLRECAELKIPAFLNGLYRDSMPETAKMVLTLSKRIPNLNLQIDPTAFERFEIKYVPSLVVENGHVFDVIYGHLPIKEGLMRIAEHGETQFTLKDARKVLGE